ncbi:uncharacterized protein LOC134287559 [Aedes albopictus]|uniref:Endonuclease/exonuclease/phosphatase domain-containing protein n=1 Tax=Aedes albopictus TaxID=7160 RepID=A0ABM1Z834_AEDAL
MMPHMIRNPSWPPSSNRLHPPGCTPASLMEAPEPLGTVEPFQPATNSHPGPVFECGEGVFQSVNAGKYNSFENNYMPLTSMPCSCPAESLSRSDLGGNAVSSSNQLTNSSVRSMPPSSPGCTPASPMEALSPLGTVEPFLPATSSHPGPVSECGVRVFQPANAGKYHSIKNNTLPSTLSASSHDSSGDSTYNAIWMYYQNVRGLRTRIDELLLATSDCRFDVIILTETGLNNSITSQQLFGSGFNVYRCDRSPANSDKSRFGGVLIAIAQRYASRVVHTVCGRGLEQICVSSTIKGRKVLICGIYIPPDKSQNVSIINDHLSSMNELCEKCSPGDAVLVCGDYNQPHMRWCVAENSIQCSVSLLPVASSTLLDGMDYLCLVQRNVVRNQLDRTLDLVFCSPDCEAVVNCSLDPLLPVDSHHPPLEFSIPACLVRDDGTERPPENRPLNFRKLDFVALLEYLQTVDWTAVTNCYDVDDMAESFCTVLNNWLVSNVPRTRPPVLPAWSTPYLRKLRRVRNACQRKLRHQRTPISIRNFQRASNAYRFKNASLYKSYVLRIQMGLRRNPRGFWRFVNSKRKSHAIPANVYLNEVHAVSAKESCQLFAKHFSSIFATDPASTLDIVNATRDVPVDVVDIGVFNINPEMVKLAAKKLKRSFVPGPDGLPAVVICRCICSLAQPLCDIFNRSLQQAKFPRIWKQSFMIPVFQTWRSS